MVASMSRFSWIEILLLPLAVALLEATWLSRLLLAINRLLGERAPIDTGLPLLALAAHVLAGAALARLLLNVTLPLTRVRQLALGSGALAVFVLLWAGFGLGRAPWQLVWFWDFLASLSVGAWGIGMPIQLFALVAAIYLWWRGLLAGRSDQPYPHLLRTFILGVTVLSLLAVVAAAFGLLTTDDLVLPLVVYFAVALAALALASLDKARRHGRAATGVWLALNRYWTATITAAIGLMLLTGLIIGWLLAPETLANIFAPIATAVLVIILSGFYAAGLFTGYLFTLAKNVPALRDVLQGLFNAWYNARIDPITPPQTPDNIGELIAESLTEFARNSPAIQWGSRVLTATLLLSSAVLLFWFVLRRFTASAPVRADEQRESIASRKLIARQIQGTLRDIFARPSTPPPPYLALTANDPGHAIRQSYQHLLAWAAENGHPRQPAYTPSRYAQHLSEVYPQAAAAIRDLTARYVQARYTATPPTPTDAQAALTALNHLRTVRPTTRPTRQ